jgi:S1-C subfamily serine protease
MKKTLVILAALTVGLGTMACSLSFLQSQAAQPPSTAPIATLPAAQISPIIPVEATGDLIQSDLAELYTRANPGVVTIWTFLSSDSIQDESIPSGQGSGFVIDQEGHIVTNQHVIEGADEIEVDFPSGYRAWANVLGTDPDSDLAVLEVNVPDGVLFPLPLGDSNYVRVGEPVVAIGNPFGLSGTITQGIVSAIGRTLESERSAPTGGVFSAGAIIQTDAAINPGNSGGPLLNLAGEVIGVNRAIRTESFTVSGNAASSGVGFAVPVNIVRRVAPSIIATGEYLYPYLGVSSLREDRLNLKIISDLGLEPDSVGAYVTCVTAGGPAEQAGIEGAGRCNDPNLNSGGDLIVAINNQPVKQFGDLLAYLLIDTQVGDEIIVTVLRGNEQINIPVTIGARP